MRALVAVGRGRYADPWHAFEANALRVAEILVRDGWTVRLDTDVDGAMTRLDGVDLLVVAAGDPWGQGERRFVAPRASRAGLRAARERGLGVMGLHAAVASLRDYPCWAPALGAVWIPGASSHPPRGQAHISVHPHALTAGIEDFVVHDERYCHLQPLGEVTVLATHAHDGVDHPLVWVRERPQRAAYDALGHDTRSYDSPEHETLVRRLARWAARAGQDPAPSQATYLSSRYSSIP
ncbi:ThuA domain-containing protein [Xylanimonas ulmi]|uniref:ThuA-like domain-containing protein n=1 Tax=Xylanimonas ulmi TaxID=228973 RepID=A0A4Q7M4T2_9MICO|nr:ThuA domain-containing protein [Xylanibacterium ulmi]RZS61009.1 hypothetical protein EV386_1290 [Xylanibacterium ulmi]